MKRRVVLLLAAALLAAPDERLARHRNLGKAYFENPGTHPQAVQEFQKALALAPDSARERLNLGLAYLANGQTAQGIAELERVQKQDPSLPHTWFNLGVQFKKSGDYDKALRQMEQFVKLVPSEAIGHYNLGTLNKLADRTPDAVRLFEKAAELDPNLAAPHFQLFNLYRQAGRREDSAAQLKLFQQAKENQSKSAVPEDVDWSFYSEIYDPATPAPPSDLKPIPPKFAARTLHTNAPGMLIVDVDNDGKPEVLPYNGTAVDINNDGWTDVCVVGSDGPYLLVNAKGKLNSQPLPVTGKYSHCVALDYDRDYDQDLFLFGERNVLLRNQGEAGFAERTQDFPFVPGVVLSAQVFRLIPDTKSLDLIVTYQDRPAVLYRDRLAGQYETKPISDIPPGVSILQVLDVDADGSLDLVTADSVYLNANGQFTRKPRPPGLYADFDNRGVLELHAPPVLPAAKAYATADFNADGKLDVALLTLEGTIQLLTNQTQSAYLANRLALTGVKNMKLAPGAEVEVKAGVRYQKQLYPGYPLHFGLANYKTIDTVRITWPNGLIQNEANQVAGKPYTYKEAERLSGSCPQVWTWNGRDFQYVTDVLGVAPLGASDGEGSFFPTDHLEHIQLPALAERDGAYEIRLTEELAEVAYLDQIRLIAVDHPATTEVFLNEKFQSPPYPPLEVYSVRNRRPATRAANGVFTFAAPPPNPLLILRGWTDWADGSQFRHFSQVPGKALAMPALDYQDSKGNWQTALPDLGLPAGKPKAFAVRVPAAREYRIRTNIDVTWSEVSLAEPDPRPIQQTEHTPQSASLQFRGFSRLLQTKPDLFAFANPAALSMWNPTPGRYTEYGDVSPLMTRSDDQFVIMGSGDELTLRYSARDFPPVPAGHRRSWILAVDGWAKDQDPNTAHSQSVEPLPFHAMPRYPYPSTVHHPGGDLHHRYNTRPSIRHMSNLATISE